MLKPRQGNRMGRMASSLLAATAILLCAFGGAGAKAAEYTVNSLGDQVDEAAGTGGCKTAVATCTLRAAIEESNFSTEADDTIKFGPRFDGQLGDTIELATPLPTVTDRVRIAGFPSPQQCDTDYFGTAGPCVGIDGPAGGTAFRIEAERVVLIGFAISGAETAIEAVGAPVLEAWNDWLGIKLDGSAGAVGTGVSVDQESNGANLGGASSVARMIFAHNTDVGLDIDGADATSVRGSGFGVLPDGASEAANGTNIEITDAASGDDRVARANWIGGILDDEQLESPICDGSCNVISGATASGIDLIGGDPGEKPTTGATRIFGNYIGLTAFGQAGLPNAEQGVLVGSSENATIGGPRPGDRNLIAGGDNGVLAEAGAGNLSIENNWFGLNSLGSSTLAPPSEAGIAIEAGYQVEVTGNRLAMASGTAIDVGAQEAVVRFNAIGEGNGGEDLPGGAVGIHLFGSCFWCTLAYGNTVANAGEYGVLIESGRNHVYGNRIEAAGSAGVRIEEPPPHGIAIGNVIGGDSAAEENAILASGGPAVEIVQATEFGVTRRNVVARNNGALNGGAFIDLIGGANEDIPPPAFSSATSTGASGEGAVPGATIRVFRKASGSPGELGAFLAETVADGSGNWEASYPSPIPGGTLVAAAQTGEEEGTSELSVFTTATEPDGNGEGEGGGETPGGASVVGPPPPDRSAPQTSILKAPPRQSLSRSARFRFGSSEPGSRFRCKLDNGPATDCRSPLTYRVLRPGRHRFRVWATDPGGNTDPSPARSVFRVLKRS